MTTTLPTSRRGRRRPASLTHDDHASRVALYLRQSQDTGRRRGEEEGLAIDRQEKRCRALAQQRGWTVTPALVFKDNDQSASKDKRRPGWTEMLRRIEAGEIDVVIAWALDRLLRKPVELEHLIDLCEPRGVRVITVQGDLDFESPQGKLAARTFSNMARFEADQKAARQVDAEQQAVERGRPPRRRAFGYKRLGMEVEPAEAEAVADSYELLLAGSSLASIARMLNDRGLTTILGRPWEPTAVRAMLLNARNAAIRTYYGEEVGSGTWPAIVSEQTYRMAVALLRDPARRTSGGTTARKHQGAGLYRCGICAAEGVDSDVMTAYRGARAGGGRIYRCRRSKHLTRLADPIDAWVDTVMEEMLSRSDDLRARVADDNPELAELDQRERAAKAHIRRIDADYTAGEIPARLRREGVAEHEEELARIADRRAELTRATTESNALQRAIDSGDPVAFYRDCDDVPTRQAIIGRLVTVTLLEGRPGRRKFDHNTVEIVQHPLKASPSNRLRNGSSGI